MAWNGVPVSVEGDTVGDVVDAVARHVQDQAHVMFDAVVMLDAVRYGLSQLWPSMSYRTTEEVTLAAGTDTFELPASLVTTGLAYTSLAGVEYRALSGGPWRRFRGFSVRDSNVVELAAPLTFTRRVRLLVDRALYDGSELTTGSELPGGAGVAEVVALFACAWLLEGYASKRIAYDKYTTVTADEANTVYDVQSVARAFRTRAAERLAEVATRPRGFRV